MRQLYRRTYSIYLLLYTNWTLNTVKYFSFLQPNEFGKYVDSVRTFSFQGRIKTTLTEDDTTAAVLGAIIVLTVYRSMN